jgi:hypothetical protein
VNKISAINMKKWSTIVLMNQYRSEKKETRVNKKFHVHQIVNSLIMEDQNALKMDSK